MTPAPEHAAVRPYAPPLPARASGPGILARPAHRPATPSPPRDHPSSHASADLPPEPAAAARARRLTRDTLARWHLDDLSDDAQAIASELAANAITAATRPQGTLPAIIFAVHQRPGQIRIIVWDNGPGQPRRAEPGLDAERGRGLGIIDALTGRNWGWWPTPESGGKVVWAALATGEADPC